MDYFKKIIGCIEVHDVEGIRSCFSHGVNPNDLYNGKPLIYELTSEYLRGPAFKECVKVFVEFGLQFGDEVLLSVLLDDADVLRHYLQIDPDLVESRYSLRCTYTPLEGVTLMHICAEYNHINCAEVLGNYGANIEANAGVDKFGFGGQTPIFHTVNQNQNNSLEMMEFLLSRDVDLSTQVTGLIWGKGYEWETFIPAVNPISYAMMGLLPQMHRDEETIAEVVSLLMKKEFGIDYLSHNIPNKYLLS